MVDKLLKDINSDGGRTKIHINEIADDLGRLLGDLTGWEIGDNANGTLNGEVEPLSDLVIVESGSNSNGHYIKFGNGVQEGQQRTL